MRENLFKLRVSQVLKYLVPIYLVYAFAVILPLILSFVYSFFDDYGTSFSGWAPYSKLLQDSDFWLSFKNNMILVLICVAGQVGIAFIIASLLMSKVLKLRGIHRRAIFLPVVLAPVVTGYLWTLFYNYQFGILNWFVKLFGGDPVLWLDDPAKAIYLVSIPLVWQYVGLYLIIFLAGMQNISKEIYDAVEIDGANWRQKTMFITFPLLKNVTQVALVLCISGTMKTFDHIFVMTGGGPGRSTMVMAQYSYNNAFLMTKLGYASTVSIGMIVLSGAVVLLVSKLIGGKTDSD
ncbi:carbohydrate ABC transporter permease [Cohnella terricola]|uniref:Sugar ABC transporter permease n=1 Tax=Cohnella terricola TaxID=1289167 RepID=A0A559JBY5_9BACL|nr:sugar ABC transporter permease [Cohnella terricola]TVX97396.1 sugar ABC transporter permease [Cohnella terricola]